MEETEELDHLADGATEPRPDVRLLRSITLRNILSFGPKTPPLELRALNVLIGPNGSGKSNLLACIGLLRTAPEKLAETVRTEGGIQDWLWKGSKNPVARVEVVVARPEPADGLRHWIEFKNVSGRFELVDERIEGEETRLGETEPAVHFGYLAGQPIISSGQLPEGFDRSLGNVYTDSVEKRNQMAHQFGRFTRSLRREDINPELSIIAQRRDPDQYPELTYLGDVYPKVRLYREWTFGPDNPARGWHDTAGRNDYLSPNADNLANMLSRLRGEPETKRRILELLDDLYEGITSFDVQVFGGRMQAYLEEGKITIPASRLSDGTLRFLFLLVILLHPTPPPLICLEEPELGLHPDVIVAVGKLIKEASTRTQLIVTTHSTVLMDTLSGSPEDVIVCGKEDGATVLKRLDADKLQHYLEDYSLGTLWSSGDIGGNRW